MATSSRHSCCFVDAELQKRQFIQALPLLLCQLNTVFIWGCFSAEKIGYFNHQINQSQTLKGNFYGIRDSIIENILLEAGWLEPLSLFLYTWRFLDVIEKEEENWLLKRFYMWFSTVTIICMPLGFYSIYATYVIEAGLQQYYVFSGQIKLAQPFGARVHKLDKANGWLTLTCNLISCIILCFILRLFHKITRQVSFGQTEANKKHKLNQSLTIAHIGLILGYSVICLFIFNIPPPAGQQGVISTLNFTAAWFFVGGVCDLLLTCLIWFILDD